MAESKSGRGSFVKSHGTDHLRLQANSQNQPKSTKNPRTVVPLPQTQRIVQRYVAGESIRQIAREEKRDRATVTKIVRSDEMKNFVQHMRERFYGLGLDAMDAVSHALKFQKNAAIGYRLLADIGVIPSPTEKLAVATQAACINKSELTPFQVAMAVDENGQINRVAYGAACVIETSAENFGTPLPTPEEVYHRRKVAMVADEIAGGRFLQICLSDGPEEKRIRRLAEEQVKRDGARTSLPPRRVQRALIARNLTGNN
jgi:hypothetical protein